ncbi:MAG: sialate O-acetylesterase [Elusimicrobiota bacterium]
MFLTVFFVLILLSSFTPVYANVTLSGLFSDNMVLQRGMETKVWGYADTDETIIVEFNDQKIQATPGIDGKWMVLLKNLQPGGPHKMVISGKNIIELNNILVGDVWVCSGQSNMAWPMSKTSNAAFDVANSTNPLIRIFTVPRISTTTELELTISKWSECLPATVLSYSGVAYFFGKNMVDTTKVPVGLINASVGATPIEPWMSQKELTTNPVLAEDYKKIVELENSYTEVPVPVKKTITENIDYDPTALADNTPKTIKKPVVSAAQRQSVCYNGMISPLLNYTIKGVIWYQGENNSLRTMDYGKLFPAMITSWRQAWNIGEFPFIFVQLAYYGKPEKQDKGAWSIIQEAQLRTWQTVPNTGMVVTLDIGDVSVHPKDKSTVGYRLSLHARKLVFSENIECSGPVYDSVKYNKNKAYVKFTHAADGIKVSKPGEKPLWFCIAGEDKVFYNADTVISGKDTVTLTAPEVKNPVAVRYAWAIAPVNNIVNSLGLPASPFRTDNWDNVLVPLPPGVITATK